MAALPLADLVVVAHLAYVGFVVFGYVAVPLGWARGWTWVRNRLFRRLHVAAIALVAVEAVVGVVCPLTVLENLLRPDPRSGTFVGRLARALLYYDFPPWVFTVAYVALALLAAWLLWAVPPRRRGARLR